MSKLLAIIDLDGVCANSDVRFEMATQDGKIDWKVAFDPSLLIHDVSIEGARDAVLSLQERGYKIIYLTSRPEHMQQMTQAWLDHHEFSKGNLICKPASEKYTKTAMWKYNQVEVLTRKYDLASIFVDDEEKNREIVEDLGPSSVRCFASLADALASLVQP